MRLTPRYTSALTQQKSKLVSTNGYTLSGLHPLAMVQVRVRDPLGLFPRTAPFAIWNDPVRLPWTKAERAAIEARGSEARWMLEPIPPADHLRPLSERECGDATPYAGKCRHV